MVFGRGGLVVGELRRVDLVGLVEDLYWLGDLIELNLCDLVHLLDFLDVALKLRRVGQARGRVFWRINIF